MTSTATAPAATVARMRPVALPLLAILALPISVVLLLGELLVIFVATT
jgi:hypothetical protein